MQEHHKEGLTQQVIYGTLYWMTYKKSFPEPHPTELNNYILRNKNKKRSEGAEHDVKKFNEDIIGN